VNVFGALVDYFGGTYEFAVMDHEKAVSGFYVGGGVMATGLFGSYTDSYYTYTYSGFLPGFGVTAGYKWILNPSGGFFLEPSIGYSLYMGSVSMGVKDTDGNDATGTGTIPAIGGFSGGLGLGWAF